MKKNKKEKVMANPMNETVLDIPKEEIWTYQVEGLAAPHIGKPYTNYNLKKAIFIVTIFIAIMLSMYFSIRAVQKDTFEYKDLGNSTYEFVKFSNTGYITELDVDYVTYVEYNEKELDPEKNFSFVKDEEKPITVIHEYAFNCDEKLEVIRIGAEVSQIDGKSFYTCKALKQIIVDDENKYYCDIDGVLYNKDKTEIICYPMNYAEYLREKYGYEEAVAPDAENYGQYVKDVLTYVVPSSVEKIGKLCFNNNWSTVNIYLPEGLKTIETLAFFKNTALADIYTYKTVQVIENTDISALESFSETYFSLPEGLEYIGSDAFSYNQSMSYVYIPSSVTFIGHHAFWGATYDSDGQLYGITQINVAANEQDFRSVHCGDGWRPQYDNGAFGKSVDIIYEAIRE